MASKIKIKTIKATSEDPDIASIFNDMMNGNIKIDIVHKKYELMKDAVIRFGKLIKLIIPQCGKSVADNVLQYYMEFVDMTMKEFNAEDLDIYLVKKISARDAYKEIPEINKNAYVEVYKRIKTCQPVNAVINTLHEINSKRKNFVDENKTPAPGEKRFTQRKELNGKYLIKHPDPVFAPICGLPSLNLKDLYLNSDAMNKEFILKWIQKLFMICYDLYEATNIPDIDPEDMVEVVMSSIDQVKKQIPRCDRAFDKIKNSVGLLKNNFNDYYANFVESNNPSIIIESFITDVSNTGDNDPIMISQFKKIIKFYKDLVLKNKQFNNSKINKVFDHVDKQMKTLSDITGVDYSDDTEDVIPTDDIVIPEEEIDESVIAAQQSFMDMIIGGKELSDDVDNDDAE